MESTGVEESPRRARSVVIHHVGQFLLAGFVALVVLTIASLFVSRRAGTDEAIQDAKDETELLAHALVEPRLTPDLIAGNDASIDELSSAVWQVAAASSFEHVRLWTREGLIVFSDQSVLTGTEVELGDGAQEAFESGDVIAEVSDLTADENVLEREQGRLLEVYQPVIATDGTPLLLEAYFPFDNVDNAAQEIWWRFLPAVLIPLALLQVVQIPLALRLARKVQRAQEDREILLQGVINASDNERKAIAADLHDGAVQDLTGATYALSVASERATRNGDVRSVELLTGAQIDIRRSIQSLRSLFVEIYPPNLQRAGLQVALSDLLAALAGRGITSDLSYPDNLELPMDVVTTVYRVTQEATRNVARHSNATDLHVALVSTSNVVGLTIRDNGVGFDPEAPIENGTNDGHLGLPIMTDLAQEAGGSLSITSAPGAGTEVHMELPL